MVARDSKGRFVKGASGNPQGRLPKEINKHICKYAKVRVRSMYGVK